MLSKPYAHLELTLGDLAGTCSGYLRPSLLLDVDVFDADTEARLIQAATDMIGAAFTDARHQQEIQRTLNQSTTPQPKESDSYKVRAEEASRRLGVLLDTRSPGLKVADIGYQIKPRVPTDSEGILIPDHIASQIDKLRDAHCLPSLPREQAKKPGNPFARDWGNLP